MGIHGIRHLRGGSSGVVPVGSWDASTSTLALLAALVSHSRTSLATMFDSTGKLTYAPNNLLTYSNTFSNAAWTKNTAGTGVAPTLTDSYTTAPDGSPATRFVASLGATPDTALSRIYQLNLAPASASVSTFGIWAKTNDASTQTAYISGSNAGANFSTITVTPSWQFFSTYIVTSGAAFVQIGISGASSVTGLTTSTSIDMSIAEAVSSAVTYETTPRAGDKVITTSAAYYGPRIDYDPNTLAVKGLLIEEARTNIVLQNRDFTNAAWTKGATATVAKDQTGIDGVSNSASSFTGGAVSGTNTVLQSITLASSTRAQSAWVKRLVGSGTVNMTTDGGTTWNAITLTAGWTQVQFSQAAVTNPNVGFQIITNGDKIAVDFVQNETGTFATSVLQTAASSVTRAADVVQFTGAALTALQGSAGSVIVESASIASASPASITNIIRGTNSILYRDTTGKTGTTNGTTALLTAAAPTWNAALRNGLAWSTAGRSITYTSGAVATDANAASNGGTLYLGSSNGSAVEDGWYKSFAIYNQRLPDATLQAKLVVGANY